MTLDAFQAALLIVENEQALEEFCRQHMLHGTPFVFNGREAEFFAFKKSICDRFQIHHTEVFIVGSGKLGFSPLKQTDFSLDSDIDVAIVSPNLSVRVNQLGAQFDYRLRRTEISLTKYQKDQYYRYLRYKSIGWIRPDLIPLFAPMMAFKNEWFDFFNSISYGRSDVGNYEVTAGVFESVEHLERYTTHSLKQIKQKLEVRAQV